MSSRQRYLTAVTRLTPLGALGVSLTLGAAPPAMASQQPAEDDASAVKQERVAERLAAIREAVSAVADDKAAAAARTDGRLAWGNWGYGWGWPNWNNWHNWRNWGNWFRNW